MKKLLASVFVAAAGAVTAIVAAVQHEYGICTIALFAVTVGAFGVVLISQSQDAATDHADPSRPSRTNLLFGWPPSGSASTAWPRRAC
ncbi:hypothetical protein [Streptomyces zaomyceticus]|uniref:hypothetical protein n=1 Tax=Streptomyces zaomyceticus TaxID=68286 RepID=UPI0016738B17|nr:hypothetical protein [Streptomyces zaomyceticus]GHG27494.1 hypothetical protein GCM10018791_49560 [Streptomyces zaomyceticus]